MAPTDTAQPWTSNWGVPLCLRVNAKKGTEEMMVKMWKQLGQGKRMRNGGEAKGKSIIRVGIKRVKMKISKKSEGKYISVQF